MKLIILFLLFIYTLNYCSAGDVDTSKLFKDVKSDMLRGLIIEQLNKNIDSFKLDVFYHVTNETKPAEGKRLAIIGDRELYSNKTLLKECIDNKVVLILMNISMDDKVTICSLVSVCNANSDDYYMIYIPAHEYYSEYAFSLYKYKKTEAPKKVESTSSSSEPTSHPNKISNDNSNLISNVNSPFNELAAIIEKESLFQQFKYEKQVEQKNDKGEKVTDKRVVVNDRTGTVFGSKSLASNEQLLDDLSNKRVPVGLLDVTQKEKEIFCKVFDGCANGDSYYVLWIPVNNENGELEKVTLYDYLKDGSKHSITFYN